MDTAAWETGKRNHLQLANAAAATYDSHYAKTAYATRCYMEFEELALRRAVVEAPSHRLALDLGCGTGRLSRVLTKNFDRVWGCDLSPAMVEQARRASGSGQGITYTVHDVEKGHLPFNRNRADLVNAGFGLFSFVRDSERFVADVYRVLRPSGTFTLSCYNAGLLVLPPQTPWAPALNAQVGAQGIRVTHNGKTTWINARAFTPHRIRDLLEPAFEIEAIVSLPTLAAVLPAELVEDVRMRALCDGVVDAIAFREDLAARAYLWVRARKRKKRSADAQARSPEASRTPAVRSARRDASGQVDSHQADLP